MQMAKEYNSIAYVTSPASGNWRWIGTDDGNGKIKSDVDTNYVTAINFAFGVIKSYQFDENTRSRPLMDGEIASQEAYFNPEDGKYHYEVTLCGWIEEMNKVIDSAPYLRALVELKRQKPQLKVILSIGGWDSDGFAYMAKSAEGRAEFIASCIRLVQEYSLDGIDLDWEYPTNGGFGSIANFPSSVDDARKLLVEFRSRFDEVFPSNHKILSVASGASQPWVDSASFDALDYINVMCYDYNVGQDGDQAGLEQSKVYMQNHLDMVGGTAENRAKINMGVPFYNGGGGGLVPYCKPWSGHIDASADLIKEKMAWVRESGYGGAFYWAYSMDVFEEDVSDKNSPEIKILQKTVYNELNG